MVREAHIFGNACRGPLISAFVFSMFVNLLMLTGPLFMLQVYDRVLTAGSDATLIALFLLVSLLFAVMALLDLARGQVMGRVAARMRTDLDMVFFDADVVQSSEDARDANQGRLLHHLDALQRFLTAPVATGFFDLLWTPLFFFAIFAFHPVLGWLALAGGVSLIGLSLLNNWLTQGALTHAQNDARSAETLANDARDAASYVRAQGMGPVLAERWRVHRRNALNLGLVASDRIIAFSAAGKAMRLFLQSAMLATGAWLVLRSEMTAGAMIAGSILLGRALAPVEQIIGQWPVVLAARHALRALREHGPTAHQQAPRLHLPKPAARIDAKNLTIFKTGSRKPALSGVSFSGYPGEAIGIIGNSGTGKSTLAKTLVGSFEPFSGEVRLGGATLDQYDPEQLGHLIGYLPQTVTFFRGTVAENIARMAVPVDEAKIFAAARLAGAHEMILSLPLGYQSQLQSGECGLSGGQRQRIALARALYGDPVLLVLDEPEAAMDAAGLEVLNRVICNMRTAGRCIFVMTHRPQAICACERVIVLDNGRVMADGSRDDVLERVLANADDVQDLIRDMQRHG